MTVWLLCRVTNHGLMFTCKIPARLEKLTNTGVVCTMPYDNYKGFGLDIKILKWEWQ